MPLVIYSTKKERAEQSLLRVIGLLMPKEKTDMCHTIDDLASRLKQPVLGLRVAILFAMSSGELDALIEIRDLLEGVKVVLILPDTEPDTVARAHRLHPRFISDRQSDFVDVAAVVNRIFHHQPAWGAGKTCSV